MQTLYVVRGSFGIEKTFGHLFDNIRIVGFNKKDLNSFKPTYHDCVIFEGGEDINPVIYGEGCNRKTYYNEERDYWELHYLDKAIKANSYTLGGCRGAQLLCAAAGGKLIQHVQDHAGRGHSVKLNVSEFENLLNEVSLNSCHHQMMYPFGLPKDKYEILGWVEPHLSITHEGTCPEEQLTPPVEPEIIWFPEIKGLAIQSHPEWMRQDSEGVQACETLIKTLIIES